MGTSVKLSWGLILGCCLSAAFAFSMTVWAGSSFQWHTSSCEVVKGRGTAQWATPLKDISADGLKRSAAVDGYSFIAEWHEESQKVELTVAGFDQALNSKITPDPEADGTTPVIVNLLFKLKTSQGFGQQLRYVLQCRLQN